ncbi:hypothetical protein D3C75_1219090 [compost metagenome]
MKAKSAAQVLNKIKCQYLSLCKGDGYWYFVYDDVERNIFETESVYTMYLSSLDVEDWVSIGQDFVKKVENKG